MIKLDKSKPVTAILEAYKAQKALDNLKEEVKINSEILESIKDLNILDLDIYSKALLAFDFSSIINSMSLVVGNNLEKLKPANLDIFSWFSNPDLGTILKCQAIRTLCEAKYYFERFPDKFVFLDKSGWMVINFKDQISLTYFLGTCLGNKA